MFKIGIWKTDDRGCFILLVCELNWVCSQWARGLSWCGSMCIVFHSQLCLWKRFPSLCLLPSFPPLQGISRRPVLHIIYSLKRGNVLDSSDIRNEITSEASHRSSWYNHKDEEREWAQKNGRRKQHLLLSCSLAMEPIIACKPPSLTVPLPNGFCFVVL